jgi:hypothetical protein
VLETECVEEYNGPVTSNLTAKEMRTTILSVVLLLMAAPVQADLLIDVLDAEIISDGTGFVDAMISSEGTDLLAVTGFAFDITDVGTPIGDLRFSDPQLLTEVSLVDYVFKDDSGGFTSVVSNSPANTTMAGGDFSLSNVNVTVTTPQRLLVRLDLEHTLPGGTDPATVVGDQQFPVASEVFCFSVKNAAITAGVS